MDFNGFRGILIDFQLDLVVVWLTDEVDRSWIL